MTSSAADSYWERKYALRSWNSDNDIHFSVPHAALDTTSSEQNEFELGLGKSDMEAIAAIENSVGVWAFQHGLKILEIGCGSVSLGRSLLRRYPLSHYVGVDIAQRALLNARALFTEQGFDRRRFELFELDARDSESLRAAVTTYAPFDLIVLRECTYLFSRAEQLQLLSDLHGVAAPNAHLHLQDVQCRAESIDRVSNVLSQRQGGGVPFVEDTATASAWSIDALLAEAGWWDIKVRKVEDDRIAFSYSTMAKVHTDSEELGYYEELASLAREQSVSYAVATAKARAYSRIEHRTQSAFGVRVKSKPALEHFRSPEMRFVLPGWHLLVGPSGAGKTRILRCLAGETSFGLERYSVPQSLFLVRSDAPTLPGATVLEHIAVFATNRDVARDAAEMLGLTKEIRSRVASKASSGELQRMSLAQAFVACAELVLLDEPTQHLDAKARLDFYSAIRRLRTSEPSQSFSSVLWVDHSADLPSDLFDEIHELRGGFLERKR